MMETRVQHVLAAESRAALLTALRAAGHALSVEDAAEVLGLHPSTTRFHLDLLVSAGLVDRQVERRGTAGRPRIRYVARAGASGDARSEAEPAAAPGATDGSRRLASVLASQLSGLADPSGAARSAGRRWVEALDVIPDAAACPLAADDAVNTVAGLMDHLGFAPDLPVAGDRIMLRRCPFEAVARDHRAVVCGVHAGMLEQTFERLGTAVCVAELEPFAADDPLLCVVHLRRSAPEGPDSRPPLPRVQNEGAAVASHRPPLGAPRGTRNG